MYALRTNFYPAEEPKNGYVGKATLDVANAVRINNISVFEKDGAYSIAFSDYGDKEKGGSYFVPGSKEVYAAILGVIEKAVANENHFAFEKGKYGLKFEARGTKVEEPYADGRYSVSMGEFGTLHGITSRWVEVVKDGEKHGFIGVNMPVSRDADGKVRMYKNAEGKDVPSFEFQGLLSQWKDLEGKDVSLDYGAKLVNAVKKARKELYPEKYAERKQSFENQVNGAKKQQKEPAKKANSKTKSKSPKKKAEQDR